MQKATRKYWRLNWLPEFLQRSQEMCFFQHDLLLELLSSSEAHDLYRARFSFKDDEERKHFQESPDIFEWFAKTGRTEDRNRTLRLFVFPALLSDFMHFTFAALDASSQGRLSVAYALLRKPLQENLFLLEVIATDVDRFGEHIASNPLLLRAQKVGSLDIHRQRIAHALDVIGEGDRFDAEFIARLRYDRTADDSFDGAWNQAVHLFTEHAAIRTEKLNINFIFSGDEARQSQWYYIYSRLPYLLFYARRVVEHVCAQIAATDPTYLADVERRAMAGMLLWQRDIDPTYRYPALDRFVEATEVRLERECRTQGHPPPELKHLPRMYKRGAFPGEAAIRVSARELAYAGARAKTRSLRALRALKGAASDKE